MGIRLRRTFENSFIGSTLFAPLFGKYLTHMYKKADFIITPSSIPGSWIPVLWSHYAYGGCDKTVLTCLGIRKMPRGAKKFSKYFKIEEGAEGGRFVLVFISGPQGIE